MHDLGEFEQALLQHDHERLRIVRDIGSFTVALFGVFDSREGEKLQLAGTGTLYSARGGCFILTAAHVWDQVLRPAARVGITLDEDIDHSFLMESAALAPLGPPRPDVWGDWGPDITLLRVPPEHLGTINAYRVFYDPAVDGVGAPVGDCLEAKVLLGTPAALGDFTRNHANITINGFFVGLDPERRARDGFDYLDVEVDVVEPGAPAGLGGVSGGGLWRILAFRSPEGRIDWVRTLDGVAFYQLPVCNGRRYVRCHGPESIRAAVSCIP
ncbi:MAG TPA: hypothetical protein VED66_12055 [Candidatus Sulfotelmatobacter sp.]|nr:hypothetical protein [Candidatus Sulfotelmatobacter sp.]